eukprot:UN3975
MHEFIDACIDARIDARVPCPLRRRTFGEIHWTSLGAPAVFFVFRLADTSLAFHACRMWSCTYAVHACDGMLPIAVLSRGFVMAVPFASGRSRSERRMSDGASHCVAAQHAIDAAAHAFQRDAAPELVAC